MERVAFRKWKDTGEVIAFFLDQPEPHGCCGSYMRIGQHGIACYPNNTILAKPEEYEDLLSELRSIGYDDLRIVKRGRIAQACPYCGLIQCRGACGEIGL